MGRTSQVGSSVLSRSPRLALTLVLMLTLTVVLTGCIPKLTAEDIASAEVQIWNADTQEMVVHPINLSERAQVRGLLDAWASLESARRLDHGIISSVRDAVLVVDFKDGRHVEVTWSRAWAGLQADYLERSEWGTNVVLENNVGMRSAQMVGYLQEWMAETGLEPPLALTEGPPVGWTTVGLNGGQQVRDRPQVEGNYVTWTAWDGDDLELYVYDIAAGLTTQLTDNDVDDHDPCLADGCVTWLADTLLPPPQPLVHHEDVFWCDLATGDMVQVTDDDSRKRPPRTSEGRVVWQATESPDDASAPWPHDIFLFEPETGEVSALARSVLREDLAATDDPRIAGDLVVWAAPAEDGTDTEVYRHSILAGTTERVTDDTAVASCARAGDKAVAWLENRSRIKVFDLTTGELRSFASSSLEPLLEFSGRTFLLRTSEPGRGPYALALDLDTGRETALPTSVTGYEDGLAVGVLPTEHGTQQIWLFDRSTGAQVNVSGRPDRHCVLPSLSDGRVVWVASENWDASEREIHLSYRRADAGGE